MILSCDPPRHAFLVHFGARRPSNPIEVAESKYRGARVEVALSRRSNPPSLVAIHFVRHGFRLPFIDSRDGFSTDKFNLRFGRRHERNFFFHFSFEPGGCEEWRPIPGLMVLLSDPPQAASSTPRGLEGRAILRGFEVDLALLDVNVDVGEFTFEFGADNLKDVPVTLFC